MFSAGDTRGAQVLLALGERGAGVPLRELALVGLAAAVITYFATGPVRVLACRIGAVAVPRERDVHVTPVPRMGGLAMYLGVVAGVFLASQLPALTRGFVYSTGMPAVLVAGGVILIVLGLLPKMAALVESLPTVVLGGAGLVMFGMVATTGIRILGGVDFKDNRHNALIVAISIGVGMIPLLAPNFRQWMPHAIHPLIESGILLATLSAVVLNLFFNGARHDEEAIRAAARQSDSH